PKDINVGKIVRDLEQDFDLLECFNKDTNHCILSPACKLKHVLHDALEAFFKVLDQYTLEDLIVNDKELMALMGLCLYNRTFFLESDVADGHNTGTRYMSFGRVSICHNH